jgi:hypothetical protein
MTIQRKKPLSIAAKGLTAALLFLASIAHADKASDLLDQASTFVDRAPELENVQELDKLAGLIDAKLHTPEAVNTATQLRAASAAERACRADKACMGERIEKLVAGHDEAIAYVDLAKACIAREKANPSGISSRVVLWQCGHDLQIAQEGLAIVDNQLAKARRFAARGH